MTVLVQKRLSDSERRNILESVRERYIQDGFTFTIDPSEEELPDFLDGLRPDAVARKPGQNVLIQLTAGTPPRSSHPSEQLRTALKGNPDWRLSVIVVSNTQPTLPEATPPAIRTRLAEIERIAAQGFRSAAFVLSWSLLEAAVRRSLQEPTTKPLAPGSVVQALVMYGYADPESESRLRALAQLRNRIVHGDLDAEPQADDVETILSIIRHTLEEGAETAADQK